MSAKRVPRKKTVKGYNHHYRRAEGMTQTTLSLTEELLDDIKTMAAEENRSVSNFVVTEIARLRDKRMGKK